MSRKRAAKLPRGVKHIKSVFTRYFLALFSIANFLCAFDFHCTSPHESAVIRRHSLLKNLFTRPAWICDDQVTHWSDHYRKSPWDPWHANKRCKFDLLQLLMKQALVRVFKSRILSDIPYQIISHNINRGL